MKKFENVTREYSINFLTFNIILFYEGELLSFKLMYVKINLFEINYSDIIYDIL